MDPVNPGVSFCILLIQVDRCGRFQSRCTDAGSILITLADCSVSENLHRTSDSFSHQINESHSCTFNKRSSMNRSSINSTSFHLRAYIPHAQQLSASHAPYPNTGSDYLLRTLCNAQPHFPFAITHDPGSSEQRGWSGRALARHDSVPFSISRRLP